MSDLGLFKIGMALCTYHLQGEDRHMPCHTPWTVRPRLGEDVTFDPLGLVLVLLLNASYKRAWCYLMRTCSECRM